MLEETNWATVKEQKFDIAILPWGATEAHNYHLPYGTDNYQVEHVAMASAKKAWEQGCNMIVLPTIHYGVNTGQLDIPFCMNLNPSTQLAILRDLCEVLKRHQVTKLIILNGHGGNNFVPMIRELAMLFPELLVVAINWYQSAIKEDIFEKKGDHADEMETSVMMHLHPQLTLPLQMAGSGQAKSFSPKGFREGWAWTQRPWSKITQDTGVGDPSLSTPEKGEKFIDRCSDNIAEFCREINKKSIASLIV